MFNFKKIGYKYFKKVLMWALIFLGLFLCFIIALGMIGLLNGDLLLADSLSVPIITFMLSMWFFDYVTTKEKVDELEDKLKSIETLSSESKHIEQPK